MSKLNKKQQATLLHALQYRTSQFPRTTLLAKLQAADKAYHLANVRTDDLETSQKDSYSRFQELDNALVREVIETYFAYYVGVFVGNTKIFSMTSSDEQKEQATMFNTILADQQQRAAWEANLSKTILDISKYNLGAADISWDTQLSYNVNIDRSGVDTKTSTESVVWRGNTLSHVDMYNCMFDHSVNPTELHTKGEWGAHTTQLTQVELFKEIAQLKLDPGMTVYDRAPKNQPNWTVYQVANTSTNFGMEFKRPDVKPLGSNGATLQQGDTDWAKFTGYKQTATQDYYNKTKFYLKLIPSSYDFPASGGQEQIELWEVHVLNGNHILATKKLDNAHGLLPLVLGQTDSDSLGLDASGPAQIAIPYQKTAKQLMDRVMAGADKAIRDRGIYDSRFLDGDQLNSSIPDAKVPLKSSLPANKTFDHVYRSMAAGADTTGLIRDVGTVQQQGMRAAGINDAQAGQFVKGNRTLEEYNDTQANASGKQFTRALMMHSTFFVAVKRILKLNIIQYQPATSLYDPEGKKQVDIDPAQLYKADLDFKVADGLKPTEHMLSPNVQQQLLQYLGMTPESFAEYDVAALITHTIQQSSGVDLSQFKKQAPAGGPPQV